VTSAFFDDHAALQMPFSWATRIKGNGTGPLSVVESCSCLSGREVVQAFTVLLGRVGHKLCWLNRKGMFIVPLAHQSTALVLMVVSDERERCFLSCAACVVHTILSRFLGSAVKEAMRTKRQCAHSAWSLTCLQMWRREDLKCTSRMVLRTPCSFLPLLPLLLSVPLLAQCSPPPLPRFPLTPYSSYPTRTTSN